jgi:hypothetical protein
MFYCAYSGRVSPELPHSLDARDLREVSFLLAWQDGWCRGGEYRGRRRGF